MTTEEEKNNNFKKYALIGVGVVLIVKGSRSLARLYLNQQDEKARRAHNARAHDNFMAEMDRIKGQMTTTDGYLGDIFADLKEKNLINPDPESDPT